MDQPLGSKYVLQEALGRGAMGQVFAGSIRPAGKPVAIKVLRPELLSDPEVVARFVQERTILMSIADPHVVRVIDLVVEGDTLAIVMELVQGPDLRRHLRARGTVPPAEALHLTGQLLRGVAAIHAAGIVHRDIKPENVLVDTPDGRPWLKLTDFGVARLSYGGSLTKLSGLIGTPEYMAPELAEHSRATPAADIYSAGIVLYEMLCGRTPFAGGHPVAVLRRQADQAPPVIPGVPAELWDRIAWMLAKDPGARPSSAAEAYAALAPLEASLASWPALAPWAGPESWTPTQTALTSGQAGPQDRGESAPGATVLRHRGRGGVAALGDPSGLGLPGAGGGLLGGAQMPLTAPSRRKRQVRAAVLAVALVAVLGLVTTVAMAATHRMSSLRPAADKRPTGLTGSMSPAAASTSARPTGARTASGSPVSAGGVSGSTGSGGGPSGSAGFGGGPSGSAGSGSGPSGSTGSGSGPSGSTAPGGGSSVSTVSQGGGGGGTGTSGTGKTGSGPTQSPSQSSTNSTATLSAAEQQLANRLSSRIFDDCTSSADELSVNTLAAINCTAITEPTSRPLAEILAPGHAETWFQNNTRGYINSGNCVDGSYVSTWSHDGSVAGQLGCGLEANGMLRLVWIVDDNQVGIIAVSSDHQALYSWWESNACAVPAAC